MSACRRCASAPPIPRLQMPTCNELDSWGMKFDEARPHLHPSPDHVQTAVLRTCLVASTPMPRRHASEGRVPQGQGVGVDMSSTRAAQSG